MAEYLGGIDNPDIEIFKIKSPGLLGYDFILIYADYNADGDMHPYSIRKHITWYKELKADSHRDYSLTWGAVGYALTGPLGGLVGAVLGGETKESHVVICGLKNGWQIILGLDKDEFKEWTWLMDPAVRDNASKEKQ